MRIRADENGEIIIIDWSNTVPDTIEITDYPEDLDYGVIQGYYYYENGQIKKRNIEEE